MWLNLLIKKYLIENINESNKSNLVSEWHMGGDSEYNNVEEAMK